MPYRVVRYERDRASLLAPPELRAVHPLGKSPMVEADGLILVETGAIIEYLVERAGAFGPPADGADKLRYRQFLHYAEGSAMPPLLLKLALGRVPLLGRLAQRRVQPMIDVHLDYIEQELSTRSWFAGEAISAADVMMSFPLEAACARAGLGASRPATMAWLARVHARPAYRAALRTGGPYAYA